MDWSDNFGSLPRSLRLDMLGCPVFHNMVGVIIKNSKVLEVNYFKTQRM